MNSRLVVGVGNIYASEALFRARLRPQRRAAHADARRERAPGARHPHGAQARHPRRRHDAARLSSAPMARPATSASGCTCTSAPASPAGAAARRCARSPRGSAPAIIARVASSSVRRTREHPHEPPHPATSCQHRCRHGRADRRRRRLCRLEAPEDIPPFQALAQAIAHQQLNGTAANTHPAPPGGARAAAAASPRRKACSRPRTRACAPPASPSPRSPRSRTWRPRRCSAWCPPHAELVRADR